MLTTSVDQFNGIFDSVNLPYDEGQKFITLYSGGKGSFLTACLLKAKGFEQELYFNDTCYEHNSLYVFLDQTLAFFHEKPPCDVYKNIPSLSKWQERREFLINAGVQMTNYYEHFVYESAGMSLHETILKRKFMPNSRVDICSQILKREMSSKYVSGFNPNNVMVAIGIGIWEEHRVERAKPHWLPYKIVSPFCDSGEFESEYKDAIFKLVNIPEPYLYTIGMAHNNCAGFCVKAGLKHYRQLLQSDRELYIIHENNEEELYRLSPNMRPFLKKTIKGVKYYITLKQFRENIELGKPLVYVGEELNELDEDYGACACAI